PQGDDPLRIGGDIDGSELRIDSGSGRVGRFGVASAAAGEDEEGGEDRGEYSTHDFLFTSLGEPSLTYIRPSKGMPAAVRRDSATPRSGSGPDRQLPAGVSSSLSIGLSAVLMLRTRNTWSRATASSRDRSNISPARERELTWAASTRGR